MPEINQDTEIKYRKFLIEAGQKLADLPAYHRLKRHGWQVTWSYKQDGVDGLYIETLLQRSMEKQIAKDKSPG